MEVLQVILVGQEESEEGLMRSLKSFGIVEVEKQDKSIQAWEWDGWIGEGIEQQAEIVAYWLVWDA